MRGVQIYLADGDYNGAITLSSTASQISATRVSKSRVSEFDNDLNGPGIYFLLIGNDSVYVGQTGFNTIKQRIMNTHTGNIDSSWHTVVGFKFSSYIGNNELLYIENAMCEFAHSNYASCLTSNPARSNCTARYRNQHYLLNAGQIHACNQYIKDIKFYISIFPNSIFPGTSQGSVHQNSQKELFYFKNPRRGVSGQAEIFIHCGHTSARQAILKAGSVISADVSPNFGSHVSIENLRNQLVASGEIINRVVQQDIVFSSQSRAGQFLNGTAFNGNINWKSVNGDKKLKDLL